MTKELVRELLTKTQAQECSEAFKERKFFTQKYTEDEAGQMLQEIQKRFYNISLILDCISCEKCRLNGKLQAKGLGAIMRLLFLNQNQLKEVKLARTEIIVSSVN